MSVLHWQAHKQKESVKLYLLFAQTSSPYSGHIVFVAFEILDFLSSPLLGRVVITLMFNLDWNSYVANHAVNVYRIRNMFVFRRLPFPANNASGHSVVILFLYRKTVHHVFDLSFSHLPPSSVKTNTSELLRGCPSSSTTIVKIRYSVFPRSS